VWSSHARRKRLAAGAALVLHIHVQQIQQGNRLGIYVFFVSPPTRRLENDSHAFRRHIAMDAPCALRDTFLSNFFTLQTSLF
jgi:hypothetical protein